MTLPVLMELLLWNIILNLHGVSFELVLTGEQGILEFSLPLVENVQSALTCVTTGQWLNLAAGERTAHEMGSLFNTEDVAPAH